MDLRKADYAGSWYPDDGSECSRIIKDYLTNTPPCPEDKKNLLGGIVPHAGWYYSGKIACEVIHCLKNNADTCLIFGRHLGPFSNNYIMTQGRWNTPLGNLEIDREIATKIADEFQFISESPSNYEQDNTIELQLPFLKYFLPGIKIVPFGLPPRHESLEIAKRAAEIAISLQRETIVLGSTDLTHYGHNYGYLPQGEGQEAVDWVKNINDKQIINLILEMNGRAVIDEALKNQNACCSGAAGAAIIASKILGAKRADLLSYLTSYDTRPDSSFVGYAGIVFSASSLF